jgi:hypothetical protein
MTSPARLMGAASLAALAALLGSPAVHAARPLVAEDATILNARQCQVEAWIEHHPSDTEYWGAPHCNYGGNWELIAGLGELRPPQPGGPSTSFLLQAKTVFQQLQPNGWALGLSLSDQVTSASRPLDDVAVNVPLTLSLLDDDARLHFNLGWTRQLGQRIGPTWAIAGEWGLKGNLNYTLEAYGTGGTYVQAGLRYALEGGQLTLDTAVGDRISLRGRERYFAVGMTINIPYLLR